MPQNIYLSDIFVLSHLFGKQKKSLFIFDPNQALIKNIHCDVKVFGQLEALENQLNGKQIVVSLAKDSVLENLMRRDVPVFVDFAKARIKTSYFKQAFLYFPNPDGTMRCLTPYHNTYPSFLSLYNGSGVRGWLYRNFYTWAYRLGFKSMVSAGNFVVYANGNWPLEDLGFEVTNHNYSVFTGTAGENRKMIIEKNEKGVTTHFLKVPISKKSLRLVQNEYRTLKTIRQNKWKYWELPTICSRGQAILLSNVKPSHSKNAIELQNEHFDALTEWYLSLPSGSQTGAIKEKLSQLEAFHHIGQRLGLMHGLDFSDSTLDRRVVGNLVNGLDTIFHHLEMEKDISVARAHGDFTPWNQFVADGKIHVYDWELSKEEMPILYDAFHFIFQSTTLIQKGDSEAIYTKIKELKNSNFIKQLKEKVDFDFDWHWKFYLLYTASYYLPIYLRQRDLFPQAHWLVNNWSNCLSNIVAKEGKQVAMIIEQ